jgi:RimJ/RimL family protein N-acetyltransferase
MLTGPGVASVPYWFARKSIELRDFFLARYLVIEAYVWEGHAPAIRWLEWLGFTKCETDAEHPEFLFMRRGR